MMSTRFFLVLSVMLMLPVVTGVQAQPSDTAERTIDFDEAVRIALDQNTTLKRASNTAKQQDIAVARARMNFLPNLTMSTGGNRNFGRSFSQEEGGIVNETSDFFTLNARSSVNLFRGFEKFASLDQASLRSQASELNLERARQDVVFTVMERYLTFIQNQDLIRVRQEELDAQRQQLEQIQELVDAGARPVSELYQQEATVAEAEQQLLSAEREAELSKTRLIQALQLEPLGSYTFEAPSVEQQNLQPESYELDQLLDRAFSRRTDLRASEVGVQAAREGITIAQSGYYPSISLSFDYGSNWSSTSRLPIDGTGSDPSVVQIPTAGGGTVPYPVPGTGSGPDFFQPSFMDQLDNRRGGSISIGLSFPIFDRMQTKHNVEQARVDLANARYDLQDQKQQVALQVRQAYLDYQNTEKRLDVAQKRLRAAERAREAAQERYNLGSATFVELAQANADYVNAASEQVRARYDFLFQKKLIDYYLGVLNPRDPLFR
jgi:outer membrane protein